MRKLLTFAFALCATSSLAQNVPNHTIPIGRGPGVVGWGTGGPCVAGQGLIWNNGSGADPVCGDVNFLNVTSPHSFGTISCNGSSDDTAAIQAAVNAAGDNGVVAFHADCQYKITSTVTVAFNFQYWVGGGDQATRIIYVPTGAGTAILWSKGASPVLYGGISGINFFCQELTFTKTVLNLSDSRNFYIKDVSVSGNGAGVGGVAECKGGTGSIGLKYQGKEFLTTEGFKVAAEKPIVFSNNPNTTNGDLENARVSAQLYADNNPNITADADIIIVNSVFSGAWFGGTDGFKWAPTAAGTTGLYFQNLRIETGQNVNNYSFDVGVSGAGTIYNFVLDNVAFDTARRGVKLRNIIHGSLNNTFYGDTTKVGLDIDNTVLSLNLYNTFWNTGSTATIGAGLNRTFATENNTVAGPLPGSAKYVTTTPNFNALTLSSGVAGSTRGTISLCGNTSGCATIRPQAAAGSAQLDVPTVGGPIVTNATTPLSIGATNGTIAMTGLTGLTQGDLIYGTSTNTFANLAKDTNATRYLANTGTSNNPAWGQVNLGNGVTGTLPIANGGTNATTTLGAAQSLGYCTSKQQWTQSSVTGSTSETTLKTIQIPAGSMGANGSINIMQLVTYTNNANNKTFRTRFGGAGGTIYNGMVVTTTATGLYQTQIGNRNATNSQIGFASGVGAGTTGASWGFTSGATVTSAVDTTANVDVVLTAQLANSADTASVEGYIVQICYVP